jgi:hypothetical protein
MKKILAIIVAFIYLFISAGLVLQIHYCMGKETGTSVQFAEIATRTCNTCGMQNAKNKCCHDEVKFIKLQDVHKQVNADYTITAPQATCKEFNLINTSLNTSVDSVSINNHSPPDDDDGQPSLLILHHIFRI